MKKKKMTQRSRRNFRKFLDYFYALKTEKKELESELAKDNPNVIRIFENVVPWAYLYLFSAAEIIVMFFVLLGMGDKITQIAKSDYKIEMILELFQELYEDEVDAQTQEHLDSMSDEELGRFLAVLYAMLGNMEGLKRYHRTISDLVLDVEESEPKSAKEALLKAVVVDRSVVANPVIAQKISTAQMANDNGFMQLLAKSITRTKPIRKHELDDFRYMAEVIDEAEGLETYSIEELTDVFTNALRVLPGNITSDAVKKNLQKRKNAKGK